ncbi:SSU ribosomal protein S12P methylthiotransferase [Orenia metallireducens]|uniref:Ribosomal protein uS12 methylthiotransferase RimO n=1 Tax=Orenia metallireducens TaxID=1413210 RepID=A0A285GWE0_9FIRM|nr:30S ribosomal protein S12 methylthiotransferase RimO [Orenia metallireducens]PRX31052.1 SSU ribosomal protein S12P methylthiotransferase [Orenia metallireducens]SNY27889.1 SSU ribosomal protein S12P methylthiotransferase [Orenia metallireducens]
MSKIGLLSLGCAKNQVDSEIMLGLIREDGHEIVKKYDEAEVLIVNTCGFISDAKEESINSILELAEYKKDGNCKLLIVTGCLSQRYSEELKKEMPEVDAIIGTGNFDEIVEVINDAFGGKKRIEVTNPEFDYDRYLPRTNLTPDHTAYVKIAEGCNNCCSYCIIPQLRGALKSRSIENIKKEVEQLAQAGVKEVNIIAQDITQYGIDLYGKSKLVDLLKELLTIDNIKWFRLLYAYPSHLTDEIIDLIATEERILNYLDLPVQHADDEIRKQMNRGGTKEDVLRTIKKLRKRIPDITLRTSLIVGFPGESEEQFKTLLDFIKEAEFDRLGAFTYSQEEGTVAAQMPCQIPEERKQERYERVMSLQEDISYQRNQAWIGKEVEVLLEEVQSEEPVIMVGRTRRDAPDVDGVIYVEGTSAQIGDMIKVKVTEAYEYDLVGVEIE